MWRAAQRLQPLLCLRTAVAQSRFACSAGGGPSPDIGARVAASFVQSPTAAAHSIADALKPSDRLRLVAALTQQARQSADALEDAYVDRLFKLADKQPPSGSLARRAPRHPCSMSCRCTRAPAGVACSSRTRAGKTAREVGQSGEQPCLGRVSRQVSSLQAEVRRGELKAALELDRLVSSGTGGAEQAGTCRRAGRPPRNPAHFVSLAGHRAGRADCAGLTPSLLTPLRRALTARPSARTAALFSSRACVGPGAPTSTSLSSSAHSRMPAPGVDQSGLGSGARACVGSSGMTSTSLTSSTASSRRSNWMR